MAKDYTLRSAPISRAVSSTVVDTSTIWKVIMASALGTMIEWYDFYIFGSLATVIAANFFPKGNDTAALLNTFATFGAGFAARPFGALVFGRVGDLVGRKYAFLVTLLIMGGSTTVIGLLPTYASIGIAAPLILVLIRIIQGLALGGEYGGAATYVAEHSPEHRRGFYTSFIQITATAGLFVSLLVILVVRGSMSAASYSAYGWRIPFLLSIVLVAISVYIRSRMKESPLFTKLKAEGKTSKAPLTDALGSGKNWGIMLLVLFGAAAGQAVIWYTAQFYISTFLKGAGVGIDVGPADTVVALALLCGLPFFVIFGSLSDRLGRKPVMMAGNLLGALLIYPVFRGIKAAAGPIGPVVDTAGKAVLNAAGKPATHALQPNLFLIGLLIWLLLATVGMVYGPIAAFLVEAFPARIRYTSVSLPYHVGNGYFGGWLPFIATALAARAALSANPTIKANAIYAGLIWPVVIALMTFVIGTLFVKETKDVSVHEEVGEEPYPTPA